MLFLFLLFAAPFAAMAAEPRLPAFPGAEGGGRYVTGGRGGRVYYVTNLLDAYPVPPEGSLRWALTQPGPKIVMFKVSGVIPLAAKLHIRNDGRYAGQGCDITVAGETAPGDGICLKNWPLAITYAENVIKRFYEKPLHRLTAVPLVLSGPLCPAGISPPRGESPIQIRRLPRTPHRKGHRHRFPFP